MNCIQYWLFSSNHRSGGGMAGRCIFIAFLMSCGSKCSVPLPRVAVVFVNSV